MVTIAVTKFVHGAWIEVILIPALGRGLPRRAQPLHRGGSPAVARRGGALDDTPISNTVLVLVGDLHRGVLGALKYARSISPTPKAVYVEVATERTRRVEKKWGAWGLGTPLIVLSSPYRSLLRPFLDYLLHNQTALLIKGAMLFRKRVIVADVPHHLR
jgi:hypothetical protein